MGACSSPDLEPGPLAHIDETQFAGPLEPPVFEPIARSFASSVSKFYGVLDGSIAALVAEQSLDLGDALLGAGGVFAGNQAAAVNPEALANLQAAESGFSTARDRVASLKSWLPPDVLSTDHVSVIVFRVTDSAGAPIAGAVVSIDQDIGQGRQFATSGDGVVLVQIALQSTVAWTVSAAGHTDAHGVATGAAGFPIVRVTLS